MVNFTSYFGGRKMWIGIRLPLWWKRYDISLLFCHFSPFIYNYFSSIFLLYKILKYTKVIIFFLHNASLKKLFMKNQVAWALTIIKNYGRRSSPMQIYFNGIWVNHIFIPHALWENYKVRIYKKKMEM